MTGKIRDKDKLINTTRASFLIINTLKDFYKDIHFQLCLPVVLLLSQIIFVDVICVIRQRV